MKTTISTRIDNEEKQLFFANAKNKGIDGSSLIRAFVRKFNFNPNIANFSIDDDIFDDLFRNKSSVSKLEKISDKLDSIGF